MYNKERTAIILCGGRGTRLGSLGKKVPKTLVKIIKYPILWYILKALKKNKQVAILVMDSYKLNKKNPFSFLSVKKKINLALKNFTKKFIIIKIPVVSEIVYGRKVGYKITKINLSKKIQRISATNIRSKIFKI